jgi:hypothetical protein
MADRNSYFPFSDGAGGLWNGALGFQRAKPVAPSPEPTLAPQIGKPWRPEWETQIAPSLADSRFSPPPQPQTEFQGARFVDPTTLKAPTLDSPNPQGWAGASDRVVWTEEGPVDLQEIDRRMAETDAKSTDLRPTRIAIPSPAPV